MRKFVDINSLVLISIRADHFHGHDPLLSSNSKYVKPSRIQRRRTIPSNDVGGVENISLQYAGNGCRSPMEVGLYICGLLEDYRRTGYKLYLKDANELAGWLLASRCDIDKWGCGCWGHPFDLLINSRRVSADSPNVSTTSFVGRVLHELGVLTKNKLMISVALESARFIYNHLYTEKDGRGFYAFAPGESDFIHNESLAGAAWCAFVGSQLGDEAMKVQALDVARQSARAQAVNGSWGYGERHQRSVMGIHLGSNLEALCRLRSALGTNEFDIIIDNGLSYYRKHLFTKKGLAKHCNDKLYPVHMQSVAQAIFTLLRGRRAADVKLCDRVVAAVTDLLYQPENRKFAYQKHRWTINRNTRAGWTQAWAYASLAGYNRYRMEVEKSNNVIRNARDGRQATESGMLNYYSHY